MRMIFQNRAIPVYNLFFPKKLLPSRWRSGYCRYGDKNMQLKKNILFHGEEKTAQNEQNQTKSDVHPP